MIDTRGYDYELKEPVRVTGGRIRGRVRRPIQEYLPKPGEEYDETAQAPFSRHRIAAKGAGQPFGEEASMPGRPARASGNR